MNRLFEKLYKSFIAEIDCIDTGVKQSEDKKYDISTDLSRLVSHYNGPWNAPKGAMT